MKTIIITVCILVAVLFMLYIAVGEAFYHLAIDAHSDKWFLRPKKSKRKTAEDAVDPDSNGYDSVSENPAEAEARDLDTAYFETHIPEIRETVSVIRGKSTTLKGYYFQAAAPSDKWLLWFHGYASELRWSRRWIRILGERGYHVLAPDMRGHGMSGGDYIGMGWDDRLDALAWIDSIVKEHPAARILVSGVSMGGATVISLSGEPLPPQVKCLIADCGYTAVSDILSYQLHNLFRLPDIPFLYAAAGAIRRHAGYDIFRASGVEQVKKAVLPMLFIHGEADKFVPFPMLKTVFDAAGSESGVTVDKQMLAVPDAGHGVSCCAHPDLYWETYLAFADQYMEI